MSALGHLLQIVSAVGVLLFVSVGCQTEEELATPTPSREVDAARAASTRRVVEIPTLYPTATTPSTTATATPFQRDTPTPGPTVDFDQNVVDLRFTIPVLSLDRRIEGKISGQVTVVDETTGLAVILQNQGGVLLELQQALPRLELEPLPDNCENCVFLTYSLPVDGVSDEGWLRDPVFLASLENYAALTVGPHFPPGTLLGLRRSASPYDVAHTLALTESGAIYRWLATDPRVPEPLPPGSTDANLSAALADVPVSALDDAYTVSCDGLPVERLVLNPDGGPITEANQVRLMCPAFSLPSSLLPLYVQIDALLEEIVADQRLPRPPLALPLETMLDYQRDDGARLTMLLDGTVRAVTQAGEPITDTITSSSIISLTTALAGSGALQPGVELFAAGSAANILLVRHEAGVSEVAWEEEPPAALELLLPEINDLLDGLIRTADEIGPEPAGTAVVTGTVTITPRATVTIEPADEGVATPTASP